MISNNIVTDSAYATTDPESVAWVAKFKAVTMYLIPMSSQVLNVTLDFGHGEVVRFCPDRLS